MRRRAVRLTLALLAAGAVAAAAYLAWMVEQAEIIRRADVARFESARLAALHEAFELRAAQQAYVAQGQSDVYWFDKVNELKEALRASASRLDTTRPEALQGAWLADLARAIAAFENVDRRARGYAATGQKLLASDVIFADGLDAANAIVATLDTAGSENIQAAAQAAAAARNQQLTYAASAAAAVLLVLLLLAPVPAAASSVPAARSPAVEPLDLQLRDSAPARPERAVRTRPLQPAKPVRAPAAMPAAVEMAPVPPGETVPAAPAGAGTAPESARGGVEIQSLALVCTDLARLADTDKLPAVLEQTARTLDASGLVLWVADPDGAELVPVAAHGYPASVLARLGTIRTDAENATAAAFRTGLVQTVARTQEANGAIAAPLLTPTGCRGVMAAEVRGESEKQPVRLAAASIVAAQLASLVGPLPTPAQEREAAL